MTGDPFKPSARPRAWYQFSLKAMVLVTVYCAVLGKVCTVLYAFRLKEAAFGFLVFYFTWTALILAQLAFALCAWWRLRKLSVAVGPGGHKDLLDDPADLLKSKQRRWRFRIALAWAMVPFVLWIAFTASLGRGDEWTVVFCVILLHLLPLMLIDAIRYLVRQRRKDDSPIKAMRLAGIAGFLLPALVLPVLWVIQEFW
jgi:hypothetical protein